MSRQQNKSENDFKIVVSTLPGLEKTLAGELLALGGKEITEHTRAVSCVGDLGFLYKINFKFKLLCNYIKHLQI